MNGKQQDSTCKARSEPEDQRGENGDGREAGIPKVICRWKSANLEEDDSYVFRPQSPAGH